MVTLSLIGIILQKVKDYLLGSSLVSKLQAKHDLLKVAVEKGFTSAFHTLVPQDRMLTKASLKTHTVLWVLLSTECCSPLKVFKAFLIFKYFSLLLTKSFPPFFS